MHWALTSLFSPGIRAKEAGKNSHILSRLPEDEVSNFSTRLVIGCNPLQRQKQQTPFLLSLFSPLQQQNQVTSVSLEGIFTNVWHFSFCGCLTRDEPPDYLALRANGACIPQLHRTVSNEVVLNRCRSNSLLPTAISWPSREETDKTSHLPVFP